MVAAPDDDRVNEHVDLVDDVRCDHCRCEVRPTHGDVAFARRLELADLVGIERAFDARARGGRVGQGGREYDLVRTAPQLNELTFELEEAWAECGTTGLEMRRVPDGHRLV